MSNDRFSARVWTHVADAVRWTTAADIQPGEGLIAGLSFVGPILLATMLGNLSLGLTASAGSLPIGEVGAGRSAADQVRRLALSLLPTIGAAATAECLAGMGSMGEILIVLCAGTAALLGGYDRTAAIVTTRFTLFLILAQSLSAATPHAAVVMGLLTAGALWTALLWLLFGAVARLTNSTIPAPAQEATVATESDQFARWRASLMRPTGWHFALKLVSCLAVAEALDLAFPDHHLHWIGLTVVILARRHAEPVPIRITQRALGAGVGVLIAGLCLAVRPASWLVILCIAMIASTRPLLKARHYLSYSAMMTTLIVLMMDFDQPPSPSILADRVMATLAGAILVIAANLLGDRIIAWSMPPKP
jgi:fusaric acid resistance family protein